MINNLPSLPLLGMAGLFSHAHCLTDEEKQHLQEGADGKVHVFPDAASRGLATRFKVYKDV
ncbi:MULTISPECIES: hypothetical protein [unclassified Bartonella]|uniref:hypothetical protein n=1 Tax=unclassified Bartonella TaxID=2645622 RepID=UPI0035CF5B52